MRFSYVSLRLYKGQWWLRIVPVKRFKKTALPLDVMITKFEAEAISDAGYDISARGEEEKLYQPFYFSRKEIVMTVLATLLLIVGVLIVFGSVIHPVNSITYGY